MQKKEPRYLFMGTVVVAVDLMYALALVILVTAGVLSRATVDRVLPATMGVVTLVSFYVLNLLLQLGRLPWLEKKK